MVFWYTLLEQMINEYFQFFFSLSYFFSISDDFNSQQCAAEEWANHKKHQ
jgi:hypothetical protein